MTEKFQIAAAADHSHITDPTHSVLLVEADHPGWIQILQTKQRELLTEAQRAFPQLTITGISFRLSRAPIAAEASAIGDLDAGDASGVGNSDAVGAATTADVVNTTSDESENTPSAALKAVSDAKNASENEKFASADVYANISDESLKAKLRQLQADISASKEADASKEAKASKTSAASAHKKRK
jgi:hypothetical protein